MKRPRIVILACLCLLGLTPCSRGYIALAVKRGQTSLDPNLLPLASLTIVMVNGSLPLEKVVFENLATHQEETAELTHTFSDRLDYLTAVDGAGRLHAQLILPLHPGWYEIKRAEFTIPRAGTIGTATIDLTKIGHYQFEVGATGISFCGSLVVAADWKQARGLQPMLNESVSASFSVSVSIEKSQKRDAEWAAAVVPAIAKLPKLASAIVQR